MTSQILRAAHTALLTKGWCQGDFEDPNGKICPVRALKAEQTK
jgi:hypothetical protein